MARTARPEAYTTTQRAVGTRITWVREALGLSQAAAARLLGIDGSTLAKIETGDRAASIFNVIEFSNRFRVSTDFLLRGVLTGRTDEELAYALVARHPELAPQHARTATDTGMVQAAGKFRPPRRWSATEG